MRDLLFSLTCSETYFFRGGTPFTAGEDSFLPSVFPPSASVMQGMVRTAIMKGHGVDFDEYEKRRCNVCGCAMSDCEVLRAVGSPGTHDDMELDITGPFLLRKGQGEHKALRLFKVPADLMAAGPLRPSQAPVVTDIGPVCLPVSQQRCIPLGGAWLDERVLHRYLTGEQVGEGDVCPEETFLAREQRIGMARHRSTRATQEGMLYAIEHVRLVSDYGLGVRVKNCPEVHLPPAVKLGGEGRLSGLDTSEWVPLKSAGLAEAINAGPGLFGEHGFKLVFLTPARFEGDASLPAGFERTVRDGVTVHNGNLGGVNCSFVSMCAERPIRMGGWNMVSGTQKPRHSYIPAGSVFYFVTGCSGADVVAALHDTKLGSDTAIGLGHVVVGRW